MNNEIKTADDGTQYIDLTPTWEQILPTWLMMYRMAAQGECDNPEVVRRNAEIEFHRMAQAADRWNAQGQRSSDIHRVVNELEQWFLDDGDLTQFIANLLEFQRAWVADKDLTNDPHEFFQRTLLARLEEPQS